MNFSEAKSLKPAVFVFSLICLSSVRYTACTQNKPRLNGETIEFSPLPEGIPYKTEIPPSQWILSSYEEIARNFVLVVKSEPPYDVIKDVLKNQVSTEKVINYEMPFLVLASISLLGCVLMPLTGIMFFCCRSLGQCGGKMEEENMEFSPVKQRLRLSVAIFLCSVFLLIGSSCLFLSNDRLGATLPLLASVLQDSIDDFIAYRNNTIEQLKNVAGTDLKFTTLLVEKELNDISKFIAEPVLVEARKFVRPLLEAIVDMGTTMQKVNILLDNINATVHELQDLGNSLGHQLSVSRQNLTNVRTACKGDPAASSTGVCDEINSNYMLIPIADYFKLPDTSKELKRAKQVINLDMAAEASKGNETFENIPKDIENVTYSGRKEVIDFMYSLEDALYSVIKIVEGSSEGIVQNLFLSAKKSIGSYFASDGTITKYDNYRLLGILALVCTILFTILLMYCGITAGIFGVRDYDTPSTRSPLANCGGKTLMWVVALFFFTSLFINLLLGVLFLAGANITVLCKSTRDLTLLEKTIDDNSLYGYYPLSKAMFNDGTIDIRLSKVLRGCEEKKTPWILLNMDSKFNLKNMTDYTDDIPPIDEMFQELNATIANVSIVSSDADKNLNESINVGVHHIDFRKYMEELELPLVNGSIFEVSKNLSSLASGVRGASPVIADDLEFLSNRLEMIKYDTVDASSNLVNLLKNKVKRLEEKGNETLVGVNEIKSLVKDLETFLQSDALSIANKVSTSRYINRIIGWIDQYIVDAVDKYRNKVGECSQMKKLFDASASVVCENVNGSLNAIWMSLGIIAFFSLITLILCVRLAKHYRRANRSSSKVPRYTVPLSMFNGGMSSGSKKRSVNPWSKVNKNTPIAEELTSLRWV